MKDMYCACSQCTQRENAKRTAVIRRGNIIPIIITALFFALSSAVSGQSSIRGVAPVLYPAGGFAVDGDAIANYVQPGTFANVGDWFWFADYPGTGGSVFNMSTPDPYDLNYPLSYHWNDGWMQGTDLTVFDGSNKIDDHPSTYAWKAGSAPNKNEINNATVQFSWGDPALGGVATDLWCSFAADRMVNNGDAYIDFEFLQKPLTMNGTISGTFTSMGTEGGRTVGDILITIEFQRGGTDAYAVVRRWEAVGVGVYSYVEFTPAAGDIYCTSNAGIETAPWMPFGQPNYQSNQYAEGAVNLSHLFDLDNNPCLYLSTVFVRTRSSGMSTTSELKDFPGTPYQIDLDMDDLSVYCPAPYDRLACTSQADIQSAYNNWKAGFGYTGGILPITDNMASFPALPADISCTGGLLTFMYVVEDYCGKVDSCTSSFSVAEPVALRLNCGTPVFIEQCMDPSVITAQYTSWRSGFSFNGGCNATSNLSDIPNLPPNANCNRTDLEFTLLVEGSCGTDSCKSTFSVVEPPGILAGCPEPVSITSCTPQASIATAYAAWVAGFTYTGDCNVTTNLALVPSLPANAHCTGAALSFEFIVSGDCGADTCSSTFNVAVPATLVVNCPNPVNLSGCTSQADILAAYNAWAAGFSFSGDCNASSNIASIPALPANAHCNGAALTFNYIVTGDCGTLNCTSTFNVAVPATLMVNCPVDVHLPCSPEADIVVAYNVWKSGFTYNGDCNVSDNMADFPAMTLDPLLGGSLNFTYVVSGDCGQLQCSSVFVVDPCPRDEFCTYTQGRFGNQDHSMACTLDSLLIPTNQLVINLLSQGPLMIGSGSNYLLFTVVDAALIGSILPGGHGCTVIHGICVPGGIVTPCLGNYLTKQGHLNSGFIAQTLTLGLNLRINNGLAMLPLEAGKYLTTQQKIDCPEGSGGVPMVCVDSLMTNNPYHYYMLPENVLCVMDEFGYAMNVGGLFQLANDALGGELNLFAPTSCDMSSTLYCQIQSAVDMINNAFDECRIFVGNLDAPVQCPRTPTTTLQADRNDLLTAQPNPFNHSTTVRVLLPEDEDQVVLEVVSLTGFRAVTLYAGPVRANVPYSFELSEVNLNAEAVYMIVLRTSRALVTHKILLSR